MYNKLQAIREAKLARLHDEGDNGFTLIELLVVVVIIGVLIAIAIPLYLNYTSSSKNASADSDVRNAVPVVQQYLSDNGSLPASAVTSSSGTAITFDSNHVANVSGGVVLGYKPSSTAGNYVLCAQQGTGQIYVYNNAGSGQTGKSTQTTLGACLTSGN